MGADDPCVLAHGEVPLKYHPLLLGILTCGPNRAGGQCLVGSLTGAVASKRVTEAYEGSLVLNGNQDMSVNA